MFIFKHCEETEILLYSQGNQLAHHGITHGTANNMTINIFASVPLVLQVSRGWQEWTYNCPHTFWDVLQEGILSLEDLSLLYQAVRFILCSGGRHISVSQGCHYIYTLEKIVWNKGQSGPHLIGSSEMQQTHAWRTVSQDSYKFFLSGLQYVYN